MSDLHDASLNDFLAVDAERRESERVNGVPESYSAWPRDLLVRWRGALAQLRLVRSVTRHLGKQPPLLDAGLSWVDDRWFELKVDADSGIAFYVQTPEPVYAAAGIQPSGRVDGKFVSSYSTRALMASRIGRTASMP